MSETNMNSKASQKRLLNNAMPILQDNLVLAAIFLLVVITAVFEPNFLSSANLTNIMRQFGPLIMVAMGMTFVIIGGFLDLSVAGIMSLTAVMTLSFIQPFGQVTALFLGLIVGTACGLINSILILVSGAITQAEALFITLA